MAAGFIIGVFFGASLSILLLGLCMAAADDLEERQATAEFNARLEDIASQN